MDQDYGLRGRASVDRTARGQLLSVGAELYDPGAVGWGLEVVNEAVRNFAKLTLGMIK